MDHLVDMRKSIQTSIRGAVTSKNAGKHGVGSTGCVFVLGCGPSGRCVEWHPASLMITGSQIPPSSAPQGFVFPYVLMFPLTVPHSSREDRKQDCMHFILSPKDPSVMTTIFAV